MPITGRLVLGMAVLLMPGLMGTAPEANAQNPSDSAAGDDRADRTQDQEDALDAAQDTAQDRQAAEQAKPPAPKEFNFRINAPLYFNSNAEEVPSGSSALEGNPEIELGWGRSLSTVPLKLSVKLRADTDRYANVPQANEDEASGSIKVSYYDANDDQAWAPFLSYKGAAEFEATFSPWTETKNDFALGVDKLFNFDRNFHRLPASARSRVASGWSLGFSTYFQRRLRTPGPSSIALYVVPSATYVPSRDWSVSLFFTTRERWFDNVTSGTTTTSRRDFEIEPIATIAYDHPGALWPQVALQIGFERRSSNLPNKSWNQWTAYACDAAQSPLALIALRRCCAARAMLLERAVSPSGPDARGRSLTSMVRVYLAKARSFESSG
jgi:hypothetical protein